MSVKKSASLKKKTPPKEKDSTKETGSQGIWGTVNHILEAEWTTGAGKVDLIMLCGIIFICIIVAGRNPVESYGFGSLCGAVLGFSIGALLSVSIASKSLELQKMKKISQARK